MQQGEGSFQQSGGPLKKDALIRIPITWGLLGAPACRNSRNMATNTRRTKRSKKINKQQPEQEHAGHPRQGKPQF